MTADQATENVDAATTTPAPAPPPAPEEQNKNDSLGPTEEFELVDARRNVTEREDVPPDGGR